jgi:hypothetical protein
MGEAKSKPDRALLILIKRFQDFKAEIGLHEIFIKCLTPPWIQRPLPRAVVSPYDSLYAV